MKLYSFLYVLPFRWIGVDARPNLHELRSPAAMSIEDHPRTTHVYSGQSIQQAIDSAGPGDTIIVEAGTYAEQLLVAVNKIHLIGNNAKLVPPSAFVTNACTNECGSGTQAGICVAGSGIKRAPYISEHRQVLSVQQPVEGVSIRGFEVSGFSGANILVLGAQNTQITKNTLVDGATYGFLTAGSRNTHMKSNTITSSDATSPGFIAMCMDNFSGAFASGNAISYYAVGLCVETVGAELTLNSISGTCNAIFVDPRTGSVEIYNNHIGTSYAACGDFGSYGIMLDGAKDALVRDNIVEEQHNDGPAAGAAVVDDPCTQVSLSCPVAGQAAVAIENIITQNTFRNNDLDLYVNTTGPGNHFKANKCSSSSPKGLCSKK